MSDYSYPYKDAEFIIDHLVDFDRMAREAGLDDVNSELLSAILEEAARLGSEVIAPLNTVGDELGAKLDEEVSRFAGQKGAVLLAVSAADGKILADYKLESIPSWDGMAAANGRLYMTTKDGKVLCMGAKQE